MDKKGFIYVMTNPSMPGLLKVGMTKKVPTLRALDKDLNTTGVPTPFQIQYYAFFDDMISAEQQAHRKLQKYHHGKEFFKIDVATAIIEIESINIKFTKLYSKPDDDAKIVKIRTAKEAERRWREEAQRMKEEAKQVKKRSDELLKKQIEEDRKRYEKIESCIVEKKDNIEKKYEDLINEDFFNPPVMGYWFLATILFSLTYYAIGYFSEQIDYRDPTVYIVIAILSFPFSLVCRNYVEYRRKESSKYKSLIQQKNNEIESMINLCRSGKVIIECPNCYQNLRVPINKKLNVHCPECQLNFEIVT